MRNTKYYLISFILTLYAEVSFTQINPDAIEIVRDQWGVPHIFAATDREVAYGLAWAHCEDNFHDVQQPILTARGLNGSVNGKEGLIQDMFSYLIGTEDLVDSLYEKELSEPFKEILLAYVAGANAYAAAHPKEVLHSSIFPITYKDIMKGYILSFAFISNIQYDIARVFQNQMGVMQQPHSNGSNGFAFSPAKTADGSTYLISNSHQPLRGFLSWYEAHVCSEEGWNFYGASFAGGVTPFVGVNDSLGWTHCVNYNDLQDVYKLVMHPKKKLLYRYDGKWLELKKRVFKGKVRLGFLKIPFKKTFYSSVQGLVVKNKTGFYAIRFPANMVLGACEQWYDMNKATNIVAFKKALQKQQHPSLSITYADADDNILFVDNGLFPYRDTAYDYEHILPGDTNATCWPAQFHSLDELLIVENPRSGYLHHMNGAGFYCTAEEDCPSPREYDHIVGYQQYKVARNYRVEAIMKSMDKMDIKDIKRLKYDQKMAFPLKTRTLQNLDQIRHFDSKDYPELADVIEHLKDWDGSVDVENQKAAVFSLAIQHVLSFMADNGRADITGALPDYVYLDALRFAKNHLLKYFGRLDIKLGDLQKHVRGDKMYPIGGVPESISTMYTIPYKKKYLQSNVGDSFILFANFKDGSLRSLETVHCYGSSNRAESPHYDDQIPMYLNQQLKKVSLNKEEVYDNAVHIYSPK